MTQNRKVWLDNIRWSTVVLVIIYHVGYIFNGVGIPGGIPGTEGNPVMDTFCSVVYPWFMVLLFMVAGLCARYALQHKTRKQFIKERTLKLLLPSTAGLFVIHWITGYINIKIGGGLEYMPSFLVYPISAISGIGPLWFIQTLFIFSCIALLFPRKVQFSDRWNIPLLIVLYFALWGSSQILNMPILTMYRFGIYFTAFAIGYFFIEGLLETIVTLRIPLLIGTIISGTAYTVLFFGSNFTDDVCLKHWLTNLYMYTAALTIFAWFSKYFNKQNRFSQYMTRNSFGFYILHYLALIVCCCMLHYHTSLSMPAKYAIAAAAVPVATWGLNEIIKRIPVIRLLVLGIKNKKASTT